MSDLALSRRRFVHGIAAVAAASPWLADQATATEELSGHLTGRLYKTLKQDMVGVQGSLTDKFQAAKAAGFDGIELNLPGTDVEAAQAAITASGLPVDGSVCAKHWQIRHTSPQAEVRAEALKLLKQALHDT